MADRYAIQYEADERSRETNRAQQREEGGDMVESFIQRLNERLQANAGDSDQE